MVIYCLILSAGDSRITHLDSAGTLGAPEDGEVGPFFYLEAVCTHTIIKGRETASGLLRIFPLTSVLSPTVFTFSSLFAWAAPGLGCSA